MATSPASDDASPPPVPLPGISPKDQAAEKRALLVGESGSGKSTYVLSNQLIELSC
jgi:hypothetical protein